VAATATLTADFGCTSLFGGCHRTHRRLPGKTLHHVGLPWHWGYQGLVTGSVTNDLSLMVCDPNVTIHEGKAFVCNVEKG
jgi:hypothetical protein